MIQVSKSNKYKIYRWQFCPYSSDPDKHVHTSIYSQKKLHQHAFFHLIRFKKFPFSPRRGEKISHPHIYSGPHCYSDHQSTSNSHEIFFLLLRYYNKAKHCTAGSLGRTTKQLKDCTWGRHNVSSALKVYSTCTRANNKTIYFYLDLKKLYSLQKKLELSFEPMKNIKPMHRGAFCQFPFRWIYYYGSNKSTRKETGKTHLCAMSATSDVPGQEVLGPGTRQDRTQRP